MQLFENIALAVAGLRANKMRALLTMLGIIIGIGSVITIVTLGDAMTGAVMDVFNSLGANSIQIYIKYLKKFVNRKCVVISVWFFMTKTAILIGRVLTRTAIISQTR